MDQFDFIQGWKRYKPYNLDDLLSWPLFDWLKVGSCVPILGTHPTRPAPIVAWHTPSEGQSYHTIQYRLKKSICDNDIREFSIALDQVKDLDQPISLYSNITMLNLASKLDREDMLKTLIMRGANLDSKDRMGSTPLMTAVSNANFECIKLLVESGARIDIPDHFGMTPLELAKIKGFKSIHKYLENSKNVTPKLLPFDLRIEFMQILAEHKKVLESLELIQYDRPSAYPFNNVKGTYLVNFKNRIQFGENN